MFNTGAHSVWICNAHAPYCQLWPFIFPHYLINNMIFERSFDKKRVFWFSLQLLSETFLILRRTEWDMNKKVYWSSHKYLLFLSNFNKTWIFRILVKKIFKFHKNPSCGSCVDSCRQTDMTKLIITIHNFAKMPKNTRLIRIKD